jgi:alpha-L-fucosidase 2
MFPVILRVIVLMLATLACSAAEVKKDIQYGKVGYVPLLMDAYILDGQGPFPTIVYVHGGGFVAGDKKSLPKPLFDLLQSAGFNWFSVNYRLAPKYPFPAETDDVDQAIGYIKAHAREYKVDTRRMVLMGGSAGGHLVSFVGAKHKSGNRVAAVVSFYGEHDLVSRTKPTTDCIVDGRVDHSETPEPCLSPGLKAFLGVSDLSPAAAKIIREASPVTYVKKDMPPYLLVHGDKDLNVPYEQSVLMCKAMKKAGAQCEIYTVKGGGHGGWDKDPQMSQYQQAVLEWLKKTVQMQRG